MDKSEKTPFKPFQESFPSQEEKETPSYEEEEEAGYPYIGYPDETVGDPRKPIRRIFWFFGIATFLAIVLGIVALLKIWPVQAYNGKRVKISLLDYAQALRLCDTAGKQLARGDSRQAVKTYSIALLNNPSLLKAGRGAIRAAATTYEAIPLDLDPEEVLQLVQWVLKKTHTNAVDLQAAVKMFSNANQADALLKLLQNPALAARFPAYYAKALFLQRRFRESLQWWGKSHPEQLQGTDLGLYRLACLAGWGPLENRPYAFNELLGHLQNAQWRWLTKALLLSIPWARTEPDSFKQLLDRMTELHIASFWDYIGYLESLLAAGRKKEAIAYARSFPVAPEDVDQLLGLCRPLMNAGAYSEALGIMDRYAYLREALDDETAFSYWSFYGALLLVNNQPESLVEISKILIKDWTPKQYTYSLGIVLQAFSKLLLGDKQSAQKILSENLNRLHFPSAEAMQSLAKLVLEKFDPNIASLLLERIESERATDPKYWQLRFDAAWKAGDKLKDLLYISKKLLQLTPDDPVALNNRAAVLLALHTNLEEAAALTLRLSTEAPEISHAKVNYALCLALLDRIGEAQKIIEKQPPSQNPSVSSTYWLTKALIAAAHRQTEEVATALQRVNLDLLLVPEREWILEWTRRVQNGIPTPPPFSPFVLSNLNSSNRTDTLPQPKQTVFSKRYRK